MESQGDLNEAPMYIQSLEIRNIKSIESLHVELSNNLKGWHVLVDNSFSSGSAILRVLSFCLMQNKSIEKGFNYNDSINNQVKTFFSFIYPITSRRITQGHILIEFKNFIKHNNSTELTYNQINEDYEIERLMFDWQLTGSGIFESIGFGVSQFSNKNFFASGYGTSPVSLGEKYLSKTRQGSFDSFETMFEGPFYSPLRAFLNEGNEQTNEDLRSSSPSFHSFVTENRDNLSHFLKQGDLMPNASYEFTLYDEELKFYCRTPFLQKTKVSNLGMGFLRWYSMVLDLLFRMNGYLNAGVFDAEVYKDGKILLPGIVLIDEVDAHLHPTWQTRIGQWFTTYFPNIQFIVTTHSPLICRAAERGTIWRLAAPGSEEASGEITGTDRDRLIYGNVLDAYGTDVFGENIDRSEEGFKLLLEFSKLEKLRLFGKLNKSQKTEWNRLHQIFTTDATNIL